MTRFRALDSWRGICAVGVAICHFPIIGVSHVTDWPIVKHFPMFVDFFFVLSGFVISYSYWEKLKGWDSFKSFAKKRFARLWPLHIATLLPLVAINLYWLWRGSHPAFVPPDDSWQALIANVFLIHGVGIYKGVTWNGQSWSISVEFWVYFVFAGACLLAPKRYSGLAVAALALVSAALLLWWMEGNALPGQPFIRGIYGFFVGNLVYFAWRKWPVRWSALRCTAVEIGAILAVILILLEPPWTYPEFLLSQPIFGILIYATTAERGLVSKALLGAFPRLLGRLSYSIYLDHMLVLAAMGSPLRHRYIALASNPWAGDALLPVFLFLTVCVAWITFTFIEMPGTRMFGRRQAPHLPE